MTMSQMENGVSGVEGGRLSILGRDICLIFFYSYLKRIL